MNEEFVKKECLSEEELEKISGGGLPDVFKKCVLEIQKNIQEGKEEPAVILLKLNYASLPQMSKMILTQKFREKFHHSYTESAFYK